MWAPGCWLRRPARSDAPRTSAQWIGEISSPREVFNAAAGVSAVVSSDSLVTSLADGRPLRKALCRNGFSATWFV